MMVSNFQALASLLSLSIALLLVPAHTVDATMVVQPVSATLTNFVPGGEPITQAINQSGLSAGYTSGVTDFDTYVAGEPTHTSTGAPGTTDFSGNASSHDVSALQITFNLGSLYIVEEIAFWNFGINTTPALSEVDIQASVDELFLSPMSLGTFQPSFPGGITQDVQVYNSFSTTPAVQYIRFLNMENAGTSSSIAFGEVAFGATAIPEARAWLTLGLVAVGAACAFCVRKLLQRNNSPQIA
jgi:hypothetical protein